MIATAIAPKLTYSFELPNERSDGRLQFTYATFRDAWAAARRNGNPPIHFTDGAGVKHLCEPIRGQEGQPE